jgi:prefoldin subunit 2
MINGVLVERTVKDVVPALKTNSEGLRKVLEDLVKQYNSKQVEMEKWKVYFQREKRAWVYQLTLMQKKNNIQVVQQ